MNTQTPTAQTYDFSHHYEQHPAKYDGTEYGAHAVITLAHELASKSDYVPSEDLTEGEIAAELWNTALEQLDLVRQAIDDERAGQYTELVADVLKLRLESLGIHSTQLLEDLAHSKFADDKYVFWNTETQDWNTTALFHEELSELVYENAE